MSEPRRHENPAPASAWVVAPGAEFVPDGREPCLSVGTDIFFPDYTKRKQAALDALKAKELCMACHRRAECLDKARARDERAGIWGGHEMNDDWESNGCRRTKPTYQLPG